MGYKIAISVNDNKNTRHSKKSFKNKIKRKDISYKHLPFYLQSDTNEKKYLNSKVTFEDEIEHFCKVNHIHKWKHTNNIIKFENGFSLFDDPNKVIFQLLEMLHRAKVDNSKITKLQYTGYVSFGALYLIDTLCWEIGKKRIWKINCDNISEQEKQKLSKLRSFETSSYEDSCACMINGRITINRSDDPKATQSYKQKSKEITDLLQNAIRDYKNNQDYELSYEAYMAINSTIGEHFDNIVLHAKDTNSGVLCGFYDKENREITLLIYNFGKTIAQTMSASSIPEEMKSQIDTIIDNHIKNKLFSIGDSFTRENALTLLAIQEGISSVIKYDITRGHGLIDFVEHCFNLSNETKIVLISGKTAIRIDNRYQFDNVELFGRVRRVLALNDENDIYKKPSSTHVKNLSVEFPGVLIETTIPLRF